MKKSLSDYLNPKHKLLTEKYHAFYAFSNSQVEEGYAKNNNHKHKPYVNLSSGLCIPKKWVEDYIKESETIWKEALEELFENNTREEIIIYELYNHECFYVGDYSEAYEILESYGITEDEVANAYRKEYKNYVKHNGY